MRDEGLLTDHQGEMHRGHSYITSAPKGGRGVGQILIFTEEGGGVSVIAVTNPMRDEGLLTDHQGEMHKGQTYITSRSCCHRIAA